MSATFLQRHKITVASVALVTILAMALVIYAMNTDGYPVRHVALNDGGIWVTSGREMGLIGRLNQPAGSIDATLRPPAAGTSAERDLDVRQLGAAVVAWDESVGRLYPVDVLQGLIVKDHAAVVGNGERVELGGGSLAALDTADGRIRAQRVDSAAGVSTVSAIDKASPPIARLAVASGAQSTLAVGVDGTVHAVSSAGDVVSVRADASGFERPVKQHLDARLESVQATAVGSELVVLDASTGVLVLPGGKTVHVQVDEHAKLQAPSDAGPSVVIASSTSLVSVDLASGDSSVLWSEANGEPAQPTWLGGCVYGAWNGPAPGQYVESCAGQKAKRNDLRHDEALREPVFRVNRDSIVLNDLQSGLVIDLQDGRKVDNWDDIRRSQPQQSSQDQQNPSPDPNLQDLPPKAVDDTLGARAGRTTVLHVLDNDSDPHGAVLAIKDASGLDVPNTSLSVSPDEQTVLITLPPDSKGAHFHYTVDNGTSPPQIAQVTVEVHPDADNSAPYLPDATSAHAVATQTWNVAAGGTLSLPVIGDWRDHEGDQPLLVEASVDPAGATGTASTTSDGRVTFTASQVPGPVKVTYRVSDGILGSPRSESAIQVNVLDPRNAQPDKAAAQPDIARGVVGQPILVRPLDNDLPGSDPTNPNATLALAGQLPSPDGTTVVTDLKLGSVTLTATRPGTFVVLYRAAFGNAPFSDETPIRVDVSPDAGDAQGPVAMPDTSVLRGQAADLVDVLANDSDPGGNLLVVTNAEPETGDLQVAIVQGHWLHINALAPALSRNPQIVRYTVTDGTRSAKGVVTVDQVPPPAASVPLPQDDYATVRSGDVVSVPVLDNDANPGGGPLALVTVAQNGRTRAGELPVSPVSASQGKDVGTAYASGQLVRYIAPDVLTQESVVVDYLERDSAGNQATGHLHVTIVPPPDDQHRDLPPAPRQVEARATAGDRITIPIPTFGVDPEGDSVTVTGVGSGTQRGRVVSVGAASITYEAFPSPETAGTDTFTYSVTDAYDQSAVGTIRVAVVPPGDPQPPVAVDDEVTAAPGAKVLVDVLANDIVAPNARLTLAPGGGTDAKFPEGVKLLSGVGPLELTAPTDTDQPLVIVYSLSNGLGAPSTARVTVRTQPGFDIPPRAFDVTAVAKSRAKRAQADVLKKAYDPDGGRLAVVAPRDASARGGILSIPLTTHARNLPYRITDDQGAVAMAVVHVPAAGAGTPYASPGALVKLDKDASTTISVADYVTDPAGKSVRLTTTDKISAAPALKVQASAGDEHQLKITSTGGYVGPAAVNFEVTDGASLKDPNGRVGFISLPVQVGPDTPVLQRCPTTPIDVVAGGQPVVVDLASVCHVWAPDPQMLDSAKFEVSWADKPGGVSVDGSGTHTISLSAAQSADAGDGQLNVRVAGSSDPPATLLVHVIAAQEAPRPTLEPIVIDGFKVGDTARVDVANYFRSELRNAKVNVLSVTKTAGDPADATKSGSTVTITPGKSSSGTVVFTIVVSDVDDSARVDRQVTGSITMHLLAAPDKPTNVMPGTTRLTRAVELSWSTPKNNGSPIDYYLVESSGVSQQCPASPCTITGLQNGQSYRFTVKAHNAVDFSEPSDPSPEAKPDQVPDAVTGLNVTNPQDHSLTISWAPAHAEGSPVTKYRVTWPGNSLTIDAPITEAHPQGLDNNSQYTFTVVADNDAGTSAPATVQGQSAGKPDAPQMRRPSITNDTAGHKKVVVLEWSSVSPNGIAPTSYVVERNGAQLACASATATTCTDPGVALDGAKYEYTAKAKNAAAAKDAGAHTSDASAPVQVEAAFTPDDIKNVTPHVVASTDNGKAPVTFDLGASNGATSTVKCTFDGGSCGEQTFGTRAQAGVSMTLTFSPGWKGTFTLTDCNGSSQSDESTGSACSAGASAYVEVNGPPNAPVGGQCANDDGTTATFAWAPPASVGARSVTSYRYSGAANGSTGSTGLAIPVAKDGQVRTINVFAIDSVGQESAGSIAISCTDPPPDPPSINAWNSGIAGTSTVGTCTTLSAGCHWIHFQLSDNFPSGTYPWHCVFSDGSDVQIGTHRFDAGQTYGNGYCLVGPGLTGYIRINGITSTPGVPG